MSIKLKLNCGFIGCPNHNEDWMTGGCNRPEGVSINMDGLCSHARIVIDSRKTSGAVEKSDSADAENNNERDSIEAARCVCPKCGQPHPYNKGISGVASTAARSVIRCRKLHL